MSWKDNLRPGVCDKCFQHVPSENDVVVVEMYARASLGLIFVISRHFMPTESCQGSPSRAQYIEGQPRDGRGYSYDEKLEQRWRASYLLVQAIHGGKKFGA